MIQTLLNSLSGRVVRDFARHIRNFNYEIDTDDHNELLIAKARIRGDLIIIGPDGEISHARNLWTTEGHNHMLSVVLAGGTQVSTWYVAPFSGNVTPAITWTAANFNSNATELSTEYSESTRVEYQEAAPAASSTNNNANQATITAATTNVNIWGAGLLSVSTKQSTSGVLLAASKYGTLKTLPSATDTLGIKWTLTLTN